MIETNLRSVERASRTGVSAGQRARFAPTYRGASSARAVPRYIPNEDLGTERMRERDERVANSQNLQNRRMRRLEARLLTFAVAFTIIFCGLLVVYLSAYARVTSLGIEQAHMRTALRAKRLTNQLLLAELASLQNPDRISAKAAELGLTTDSSHVDYIVPSSTNATASTSLAGEGAPATDSQVANNGPITEDNYSARND